MQIITLLDVLAAGMIFGSHAWFFFVQSPALIAAMGREKFVPIQMRLTKLLFRVLSGVAALLCVLAYLVESSFGMAVAGALLTLVAGLVAAFFVVPRALRAGGEGRVETMAAGGDHSVAKFAVEGSGPSATFWHLTVVAFVVLMLAGVVINLWAIITPV